MHGCRTHLPKMGSLTHLPRKDSLYNLPKFCYLTHLPIWGSLPHLPKFGSLIHLPKFGRPIHLPKLGSLPHLPKFLPHTMQGNLKTWGWKHDNLLQARTATKWRNPPNHQKKVERNTKPNYMQPGISEETPTLENTYLKPMPMDNKENPSKTPMTENKRKNVQKESKKKTKQNKEITIANIDIRRIKRKIKSLES